MPPTLDLEDGEGEGGMGLVMSWEGAELASPEDDRKQLAAALTDASSSSSSPTMHAPAPSATAPNPGFSEGGAPADDDDDEIVD